MQVVSILNPTYTRKVKFPWFTLIASATFISQLTTHILECTKFSVQQRNMGLTKHQYICINYNSHFSSRSYSYNVACQVVLFHSQSMIFLFFFGLIVSTWYFQNKEEKDAPTLNSLHLYTAFIIRFIHIHTLTINQLESPVLQYNVVINKYLDIDCKQHTSSGSGTYSKSAGLQGKR